MADTAKIDVGPCTIEFGTNDLGQTSGELTVSLDADTQEIETEQEGLVDEILLNHMTEVTVPLAYTDKETLNSVMPWTELVTSGEESKLVIPKNVNKQLSEFADILVIHPLSLADDDLSYDINVLKCYPVPGPINLSYSRTGQRVAEVTFKALEDSNGEMVVIGDESITEA